MRRGGWCWVLLLLALPVWAQPGGRAAPVVVAQAELRPLAPGRWVVAEVVALQRARLAFDAGERLDWVAEAGTRLKAGAPAARQDERRARLKVAEARAEIDRLAARIGFLQRESMRLRDLAERNSAAQSQLDQVNADLEQARADRAAAEARLEAARLELERRRLSAPFAGVVSARLMTAGDFAGAGEAVLELVDPERVELRAAVPLEVAPFLAVGGTLQAEVAGVRMPVRVRALDGTADAQSRQLTLFAAFAGSGTPPLAGAPARLWVPLAAAEPRLAVPRDALVLRGAGAAVFKVGADGKAVRVAVRLGPAEGDWIAVEGEGLAPGDPVVVRGGERLRPGQPVRILEPGAP